MRQVLFSFVFCTGCVSKPVEEGTVNTDPVGYAPPAEDDGGGNTQADTDDEEDTNPVQDSGDTDDDDDDEVEEEDPNAVDCDERMNPTWIDEECVMAELECDMDRPLLGTTKMERDSAWGKVEYTSWTCLVPDDDYDGPEAVYYFTHPGTGYVDIKLHAPCEELSLFAVRWPFWAEDDSCPSGGTSLTHCEGSDTRGDDSVTLYETEEIDYLIVIDGPEGEQTNFTVYAECPDR